MKRRLTIARSLMNNPEVLLLDEPTTGLDPQARHVLWDRLFRLKREGVTLIVTTHYMDEAEQLCDRLVVMDHGRIVAEGSPRALITEHSTREVLELRFDPDEQDQHVDAVTGVGERLEVLPDRLLVYAARRRRRARQPCTPAGSSRCRRSCAARRSRTSSSTSPAAAWSTDDRHDRGRSRPARRAGASGSGRAGRRPRPERLSVGDGAPLPRLPPYLARLDHQPVPVAAVLPAVDGPRPGGARRRQRRRASTGCRTCSTSCPASSRCRR